PHREGVSGKTTLKPSNPPQIGGRTHARRRSHGDLLRVRQFRRGGI
uniref:Uncharacterized protein n=1 Tax=Aegilops tauschii subsp. strangulata TaxID=200361 RepID=A0A453FY95_AEGTS